MPYPLPMAFPCTGGKVCIIVDRSGWRFLGRADSTMHHSLPIEERMDLLKGYEGQVDLARQTPTKED